MGQKVSPVGLRIGINKDWESKWYAPNKDFAKYLNTDMKIRKYLEKNLKGSSVANIVIERYNKRTNVIINTAKPGVVIGRGGEGIEKHKKELIAVIRKWISSEKTYVVRYGIGLLLRLYLDADFDPAYLELVTAVQSEEYYVNMMRAWYFSTALEKKYETVLPFLEKRQMDVWTHNKTIQKSIESYRITKEQKDYLRTLRIRK